MSNFVSLLKYVRSLRGIALGLAAVLCSSLVAIGVAWYWTRPRSEIHLAEIRRLADREDWEQAAALAAEFVRHHPRDLEGRLLAARVAAGRNDLSACTAQLQAVGSHTLHGARARLREGQAWYELKWAARAEECWKECLRADPGNAPARWQLVELYAAEGRREEADHLLWELYEIESGKRAVIGMLLRLAIAGDEPLPDAPMLEQFVEADPADFDARLALARFNWRAGRLDSAIQLLEGCLKLRPNDVETRCVLTACLVTHHRADAARSRELLASLPPPESVESVDVCRALGLLFSSIQDWRRTAAYSERAISLDPSCGSFEYQRAMALSHLNRPEERRASLDRSHQIREHREWIDEASYRLRDDPDGDANFYYEIGEHCEGLGLARLALAFYKESLRLEPLHASSNLAFVRLLKDSAGPRRRSPASGNGPPNVPRVN